MPTGLGIYHYYSAVLPKIVRTLSYVMGIRGDKNLGLQQLQHAAKEGTLASCRVGCRDPELLAPARPTPRSHLLGVDIDGLPVSETTLEYWFCSPPAEPSALRPKRLRVTIYDCCVTPSPGGFAAVLRSPDRFYPNQHV
ncbi:uncharacterized protein METZ01_LOCUS418720, partial [marine metagenome]